MRGHRRGIVSRAGIAVLAAAWVGTGLPAAEAPGGETDWGAGPGAPRYAPPLRPPGRYCGESVIWACDLTAAQPTPHQNEAKQGTA